MAISLGTDLLTNIGTDMSIFGITQLLNLVLGFFTLLIITRDVERWKELSLFVFGGWSFAGLPAHPLVLAGSGLILAISTVNELKIGELWGSKKYDTLKEARKKALYGHYRRSEGQILKGAGKLSKKQQKIYVKKGWEAVSSSINKAGK